MIQTRLINAFKIIVILLLMMSITLVSIIQWKGDAIAKQVIARVSDQLEDSLQYQDLHLEWFRYFPSIALRINGLRLGPDNEPLLEGGHVDIVLQLLPLLKEQIVINRLLIRDAQVNIIKHDSGWSYEVIKKSDPPAESKWNALINLVDLEKTEVIYDDQDSISLSMDVDHAKINGMLTGKVIEANIDMQGSLTRLVTGTYKLPASFSFYGSGNYKHNLTMETQEFSQMKLKIADMEFEGDGSTHKEKDQEFIEATMTWKQGDVETFKQFIPASTMKPWEAYAIKGDTEGQLKISGYSSKNKLPHIILTSVLKHGSIQFPGQEGKLKDIYLDITYDSGDKKASQNSFFLADLQQGSFGGHSLKANIKINDLDHPALTLSFIGSVPAELFNSFSSAEGIQFHQGVIDIGKLNTESLMLKTVSLKSFIEKSTADFTMDNIRFNYNRDNLEISKGEIHLDHLGPIRITAAKLGWNKANLEGLLAEINFKPDLISYKISGSICQGQVETKGNIYAHGQQQIVDADWLLKGVEMNEVMASFNNFDQSFITSDNIKGKTTIWAHVLIPIDDSGKIIVHDILAQAAIDIKNGELQDMKTVEDFSKYIHIEDLQDIHFNEFRNYIKIEEGKVYLPVMFIQSNAINLSISGIHGFDQHILYNLKINAGQAASNKLRKLDLVKHFKQARKSGWINLYYVLSGTTSDVIYNQDQKTVISGFEQSTALKESLRIYLVDHFGFDVYWLEPNEWEDIPEYK